MSIPESVARAVAPQAELTKNGWAKDTDEARARRVILALAEDMPADAVDKALDRWYLGENWQSGNAQTMRDEMRDSIRAFLKHVAGDSP